MFAGLQEAELPPVASLGVGTLASVQFKLPIAWPHPPLDSLSAIECPCDIGCPFNKGFPGKPGSGRVGE